MDNGPDTWLRLLGEVGVTGTVVAGGCIRDYFLGVAPKDYDLFVPLDSRQKVEILGDKLGLSMIEVEGSEAKKYEEYFEGVLVGVLEGTLLGVEVNIVARVAHKQGVFSLIESFDFGVVQAAYDGVGLYTLPAFTEGLLKKEARLAHNHEPDRQHVSYERFARFDKRHPGLLTLNNPFGHVFDDAFDTPEELVE